MTDIITLPARLDSVTLRALSVDLTLAVQDKVVRIDAGAVTHMGALAAQLILAAARDTARSGGTLDFVALSDRATDQLATMGLSPDRLTEGAI